ncbi:type 4a pilus biogenesis protein PilO [bacterium]|nr:type 4a pilus biogenesis protein PilO [candidate division CSSED10-310 bacterium]
MAVLFSFWKNLSSREKVLIGAALLVAVLFVGINYVFDPLYDSFELKKKQLDSRNQLLKKYEHIAQSEDRARDKLQRIGKIELSIQEGLLKETNPDLANAELQGIVKELAKKADIKFTRITPSKPVEESGYLLISLKLPFNGSIKQITKFLYELETAPQFFDIPSMTIRTRRRDKEVLRVEMEVTAFITVPHDTAEKNKQNSGNV